MSTVKKLLVSRSARPIQITLILFLLTMLAGCQEDLVPDDKDKRDTSQVNIENIIANDTKGNLINLDDALTYNDAVVLYFTMWCPTCDSHMSSIVRDFIPAYPRVAFIMVDYVSATTQQARRAQIENGYDNVTVVADENRSLSRLFSGTMASTIVIGQERELLMNEGFKNGAKIQSVLDSL
jgi:peroxiredoxin